MNKNSVNVVAIIPARLGSTRLPEKPLLDVAGKPLIIRTCEAVLRSKYVNDVYVATDDEKIEKICEMFDIETLMTSSEAQSGSDRVYEAVKTYNLKADLILNVQGDEPLINHIDIDNLIKVFATSDSDVATLITEIKLKDDLLNPNVVKVVINNFNEAIYFSRRMIPFVRDCYHEHYLQAHKYYKHVGIYLFKNESLEFFVNQKRSKLEKAENLEQLRLIENGKKIYCHEIYSEIQGVDTPEDLEKVRKIFGNKSKNGLHK